VTAQPQPGDFAVTSISGNVGFLISLAEWANGSRFGHWDHAFVYVGDGQLVEAEPGGARLAGLDEYQGRPVLWSTGRVALTDEQRQAIVGAARSFIGTPYSAADYFAIAAHRFHLPVPWLRRYVASSKHLICSALVDKCYQAAGVQLFRDGRWNGYVTPADLAALIDA
jgi:cell wall-associated NlpC family hydrolase